MPDVVLGRSLAIRYPIAAIVILAASALTAPAARAQAPTAPARAITDITAVIDQEKADPARAARLKAEADIDVPAGADARTQAQTLMRRAQARAGLGRGREAIADAEKAVALGGGFVSQRLPGREFLGYLGDHDLE